MKTKKKKTYNQNQNSNVTLYSFYFDGLKANKFKWNMNSITKKN